MFFLFKSFNRSRFPLYILIYSFIPPPPLRFIWLENSFAVSSFLNFLVAEIQCRFINANDFHVDPFAILLDSSASASPRSGHPVGCCGCSTSSPHAHSASAGDQKGRPNPFYSPTKSLLGGDLQFDPLLNARSTQSAGK